jgi:hypothetical protein
VIELVKQIPEVIFNKITRAANGIEDALTNVAKELRELNEHEIHLTIRSRLPLSLCFTKENDDYLAETENECYLDKISDQINTLAPSSEKK